MTLHPDRRLASHHPTVAAAALALLLGASLALHPAGCGDDAECATDADCDDGLFCNGAETCGRRGRCLASAVAPCDDRRDCTADACDETARLCTHTPLDRDTDTHPDAACGGDDCNDEIPHVHPGAEERCDGLDDDCDGTVPEDRDGDGHLDPARCPAGDDCDDGDPHRHPGHAELCDGLDNDCDGTAADERDDDGDTFVNADCEDGSDCNDADPEVRPDAAERCNGADDDCDGAIDERYPCAPGTTVACWTACGSVGTGRCTDDCLLPTGSACRPPAEFCGNRLDDDCDGATDEGCPTVDAGCLPRSAECCGDGVDDDCDGATDEPDCRPHGGCSPGAFRYCDAAAGWGWGVQQCAADGSAWGPCRADAPPPGCPWTPGTGWDPACCNASGGCCQDTADLDGDGLTSDSIGLSCGPEPNCP